MTTASLVFSYGELVHEKPPGPCGCEEIDPMCQVLPPKASVTPIRPEHPQRPCLSLEDPR